jgi:glycerol-3-phosphate dehydrogenase
MTEIWDVAIVGAGVVGTAIARALAGFDLRCVLLDAADDVGTGTSKANTAILHTGFDAKPGSLESRLLARGSELLRCYAEQAGIAVERTGAVLVAWTQEQAAALPSIAGGARRNGYVAVRELSAAEVYEREPALGPGALAGLSIPDESVIDPWTVPLAFATEAVRAGVCLRLGIRVTGVSALRQSKRGQSKRGQSEPGQSKRGQSGPGESGPGESGFELATTGDPVRCGWAVNAAGLGSDEVDAMFGGEGFTIRPRKGELIVYDKLARPLVTSIVLPVPTARSKGVLVAPTVFGNVLVGPTAEDVPDRTDVSTTQAGLWSLVAAGQRIVPGLAGEEVTATYAGLRAATEHADYQIASAGRYTRVAGIRSTGLSASLGIAEFVVDLLADAGLPLRPRPRTQRQASQTAQTAQPSQPAPPVMPYLGESGLRPYRDEKQIAADPAYGEIVCHCERVTRGEIRDALASDIPPAGLDGLRRRTRAMNGRCQGFYCAATVSRLFSAAACGRSSGH